LKNFGHDFSFARRFDDDRLIEQLHDLRQPRLSGRRLPKAGADDDRVGLVGGVRELARQGSFAQRQSDQLRRDAQAGDDVRPRHGELHESGPRPQRRRPGQDRGADHRVAPPDDEDAAERALVTVERARGEGRELRDDFHEVPNCNDPASARPSGIGNPRRAG
jgi:hypothetical protein